MAKYVAKRVRFRNGERLSLLTVAYGLPVHEVTLHLESFRKKGRAANTIHYVCCTLALLYQELDRSQINLMERLSQGQFLTGPELGRLASLSQAHMAVTGEESSAKGRSNVIRMARIQLRANAAELRRVPVDVATYAMRLRYIASFLAFTARYVAPTLHSGIRERFEQQCDESLKIFRAEIPSVSKRAKLDARVGLSQEEQDRLMSVVHPDSPNNPWSRGFVRKRNWLMVVVLLATGMRRGELLGLQIADLNPREPKIRILRRADAAEDSRTVQPNTKTYDREIELKPSIMKALWKHINDERRSIRAARKIPQIFVSDVGEALSGSSIDKAFVQLRVACPGLPVALTSHVMRHTWNERFSEQADALGLSDEEEQQARSQQQGWSENSKSAATYTRRHTAKKGNEISLKLQERLDEELQQED